MGALLTSSVRDGEHRRKSHIGDNLDVRVFSTIVRKSELCDELNTVSHVGHACDVCGLVGFGVADCRCCCSVGRSVVPEPDDRVRQEPSLRAIDAACAREAAGTTESTSNVPRSAVDGIVWLAYAVRTRASVVVVRCSCVCVCI